MEQTTEETTVETTTPEASQETNTEDIQNVETTTSQASDESNIDYKAELEAAQKRIGQAEYKIEELKRKEKQHTVDEFEEEPMAPRQDSAGLAALLMQISQDPSERELIMFHYENSIKKTGDSPASILSDMENAKVLANKKRLVSENAELKRTLRTKQTIQNTSVGSNQDRSSGVEETVKLTKEEAALLARRGLSAKDVKPSLKN